MSAFERSKPYNNQICHFQLSDFSIFKKWTLLILPLAFTCVFEHRISSLFALLNHELQILKLQKMGFVGITLCSAEEPKSGLYICAWSWKMHTEISKPLCLLKVSPSLGAQHFSWRYSGWPDEFVKKSKLIRTYISTTHCQN
jgi:hypothetical protein